MASPYRFPLLLARRWGRLTPCKPSTTRRRLFFFGKESAGKIPTYFFHFIIYMGKNTKNKVIYLPTTLKPKHLRRT